MAAEARTPVPIRNRLAVLEALRGAKTLDEAARAVSLTVHELRAFCWSHHMAAAYQRLEPRRKRPEHPAFKPFIRGQSIYDGAATIVRREENSAHGNARWRIRLKACGHEMVKEGIQIRVHRKRGTAPKCEECGANS